MATTVDPETFGDYLLVDLIGTGGMADVFLAKTVGALGVERLLAIKRIQSQWLRDRRFVEMFIDEARLAVQLSDPNIAQVYELGTVNGQYYMAMEYVAGQSLANVFKELATRRAALPVPHAAYLVTGVALALDHAHRRADVQGRPLKIVHRDVSPHNVLLSYDGEVKVVDFGIAKAENRLTKTEAGTLKGKFAYMSPENARGKPIDNRSDIFAAGILLWEALTGRKLFEAGDDFETFDRIRAAEAAPPSKHVPTLSPGLDAVVLKALAPRPEDRFQHASELALALEPFLIAGQKVFGAADMAAYMREHFADAVAEEARRRERAQLQSLSRPLRRPTLTSASNDLTEIETLGRSGTVILASFELLGLDGQADTEPSLPAVRQGEPQPIAVERTEPSVVISGEGGVGSGTAIVRATALQRVMLTGTSSILGLWVLGVLLVMIVFAVTVVVTMMSRPHEEPEPRRPAISVPVHGPLGRKLARLKAAAERTEDPAARAHLERQIQEVYARVARGDVKGANRLASDALREIKPAP